MTTARIAWGRHPLLWVGFAALVLAIPILGLIIERRPTFTAVLPTLNATLNAASFVLLVAGWRAIKARRVDLHWRLMLGALGSSTLFLVFYLIRFALTGTHRYPLQDWTRPVYLVILGTHTFLAAFVPFLAGLTLWYAAKKRFVKHRRLARITFPIWAYVSVTGVVVYLMLYHLAGLG